MGFAHWMRLQAEEEREHTMKFYDFILDAGGRVQFKTIDGPAFMVPLLEDYELRDSTRNP